MSWVHFAAGIALFAVACVKSHSFRYYAKFVFYTICLIVAATVGSLAVLKNGPNTDNHHTIMGTFLVSLVWLQLKFEIRDPKNLLTSADASVVVANHQSCLDVATLSAMWPRNCVVIIKNSLRYLPGFNMCAYLCHSIYIDRFHKEQAHKAVDVAVRELKELHRKIFLFPEGTRNSRDELLPFKRGAFIMAKQAGVPIVPVAFSRYKRFYNHAERRLDNGGRIIVQVLDPINPADYCDIDEMSAVCRKRMTDALDVLDAELARDEEQLASKKSL